MVLIDSTGTGGGLPIYSQSPGDWAAEGESGTDPANHFVGQARPSMSLLRSCLGRPSRLSTTIKVLR